MIYTIGHKKNYEFMRDEYGEVIKLGRTPPNTHPNYPEGYIGGYAFKTYEDAQRRIEEAYSTVVQEEVLHLKAIYTTTFAVFGLKADWYADTEKNAAGWWHNLLVDAEIIFLGD